MRPKRRARQRTHASSPPARVRRRRSLRSDLRRWPGAEPRRADSIASADEQNHDLTRQPVSDTQEEGIWHGEYGVELREERHDDWLRYYHHGDHREQAAEPSPLALNGHLDQSDNTWKRDGEDRGEDVEPHKYDKRKVICPRRVRVSARIVDGWPQKAQRDCGQERKREQPMRALGQDPRQPPRGNGEPHKAAFTAGTIADYVVFQPEQAILLV